MPEPLTPFEIVTARHAAGLTQTELAGALIGATPEQIELAGHIYNVTNNVRRWERGERSPSPIYDRALRSALHLDKE